MIVIAIVIIYMLGMIGIGYYSSRKVSNNDDFMVAGRRLGPILVAGTLAATEIGGGSSLGVAEKSYTTWGISASWYVITMGIAFVILSFIAHKFRGAEVKTVPEYFRRRYGKSSGLVTAIIMMLPLIGLTASQFIATSTVVTVMLGIDYRWAVTITAAVVTLYSVLGGMWSITLTDFVQVILIVLGMAIAIPFALGSTGGFSNMVANVPPETFDMFKGISLPTIISLVIMYIASFTVGQEAVSRFYSARDGKTAIQGSVIAAVINFVYAFIPTILGIAALALVNMGTLDAAVVGDQGGKFAMPILAMETMPPVIVGLLFSGIISATMSSASSDLLGAGSIFGNDIYKQYIKKDASQDQVLKSTRIVMALVGLLGWCVAFFNTGAIITLLMFSFSLRAAGAFFPYVFGLYWKKSSQTAAILSLIFGSAVVVYFQYFPVSIGSYQVDPILPGLIVGFVAFILGCLIKPSSRQHCDLEPEEA